MSDTEERRKHLMPRRQRNARYHARFYSYNQPRVVISDLVDRVIREGVPDPEPEPLHGLSYKLAQEKAQRILRNRDPAEDSGYDEDLFGSLRNESHNTADEQFDQYIFNVIRHDTIPTQKRKVVVNTATMVPFNADYEQYEMWSKFVEPTLSMAPKKRRYPGADAQKTGTTKKSRVSKEYPVKRSKRLMEKKIEIQNKAKATKARAKPKN